MTPYRASADRKRESNRRSVVERVSAALHFALPAMRRDDVTDQEQREPGLGAAAAVEQVCDFVRRNSRAVVLNADGDLLGNRIEGHLNDDSAAGHPPRPGPDVAQRITDQAGH